MVEVAKTSFSAFNQQKDAIVIYSGINEDLKAMLAIDCLKFRCHVKCQQIRTIQVFCMNNFALSQISLTPQGPSTYTH